MSLLIGLFLIFYSTHKIVELGLNALNLRHLEKHRSEIPGPFREWIDAEGYQKSIAYTRDRLKFEVFMALIDIPITLVLIFSGFFGWLDQTLQSFSLQGYSLAITYCFAVGILLSLLKLPSSLYSQFVIEARYGFNKMTFGLFIKDLIKGIVLSLVFGVPLLLLVFWFYEKAGSVWWVYAFTALSLFQLFIAAVYPTLLAPLFNKFTPLADGNLKDSIYTLAKQISFSLSGIYTIDGSKRSAHSNAYFAGMGKMRRIVLFDTLMKQLTEPEIIAVLGHEMGHNKLKHVQKQLVFGALISFLSFWILSRAMTWPALYTAFHAGAPAAYKAFVLFTLFSGVFTFWLTPITHYFSRKYEYEADQFSKQVTGKPEDLATSLIKMSKENLSNLTPHPLYSAYHYTHPTTLERITALK